MSRDIKKLSEQCCINSAGIIAECKPSINKLKAIKYNPETKEVFDEFDNFLGHGTFDKKNMTLTIEHKH